MAVKMPPSILNNDCCCNILYVDSLNGLFELKEQNAPLAFKETHSVVTKPS